MRLQPLYDLQQEINRLFIAGSKFAKGDPRLLKHVPTFSKLGEKAPVFKKIATDIEDLANADSLQTPEKLSNISILLYSILYTQGETTEETTEQNKLTEDFSLDEINTDKSYLQLKPVIEALTVSNSGRWDLVADAYKQGIFKDFRTYPYLDICLGDKFTELADYVDKVIIKSIGKPMLPFLLKNFECDDKAQNIRRLRSLGTLDYSELPTVIEKILSEKLPYMQAEVINILSKDIKNEDLIISLSGDKNKVVRESAYLGLANLNTEKSLSTLFSIYAKKNKTNMSGLVSALSKTKLPFFYNEVLSKIKDTFKAVFSVDPKNNKEVMLKADELIIELPLLQNKDRKESYDLMLEISSSKDLYKLLSNRQSIIGYYNFNRYITEILDTYNDRDVLEFYPKLIEKTVDKESQKGLYTSYFHKCIKSGYSKEKLFDIFASRFPDGGMNIYTVYLTCLDDCKSYEESFNIKKLDERWIEPIYQHMSNKESWQPGLYERGLFILSEYEPNNSERFNNLLKLHVTEIKESQFLLANTYKCVMEREQPDRFETIYNSITKLPKSTPSYFVNSKLLDLGFWNKFPKEYAEKFKALHEKTKLEGYRQIAQIIGLN